MQRLIILAVLTFGLAACQTTGGTGSGTDAASNSTKVYPFGERVHPGPSGR